MNVPKLRFKEFTNEWNYTCLSEISTKITYGMNSASTQFDGLNKYIRITDIDDETGNFKPSNLVSPSNKLEDKFLVKKDDILFARTGASTGKTYLYDIKDGKLYFAGFLIKAHIVNHNSNFIFQQTKLEKYKKWVKLTSMRSGQPGINSEEYGKCIFSITSLNEENKIAKFLSLLDKKLELQTKKIEALKLFKLCISNLCFNDHKNWNYKISDFCDIITSTSKIKYIDSSGKRYIMDMGTINSDGNIIYSKPTNYDKDLLNKGDLIMPKDDIGGGLIIGKTAYIDQNNKYILGDHVFCLKSKNINSLYLHYLINSSCINKSLRKKVTGSAQLGINSKNVLNQDIFVHEKKDQDVIANTLFKIDSKVLLNKIKLEKLLFLKKGFMQNMFI